MSSKNKPIDLSIVIGALNEELRIGKTLDELARFLKDDETMKNLTCEVVVVCAEGTDKTPAVVAKHGRKIANFSLLFPGKRVGKGRDVKYGMLRTKGNYALFMDADLATPLRHVPIFYNTALSGYDLVIATRNLKKHHSHLVRRSLSMAGNLAYRLLGGVWIEDTQCGFKLFSKKAARLCFGKQTINGWGFDMEILTIAKVNNFKAKHVRIDDWEDMPGGTFVGPIIKNALETLGELLYIAKNRILGRYS